MGCTSCERKRAAALAAQPKPSASPSKPPLTREQLASYFDWVVVINVVDKRPDRIITLNKQLDDIGWCFKRPEVFEAIDGDRVGVPDGWQSGGGAWGCMQSHRQIVQRCLMKGIKSVLVMEDDADFDGDFVQRVTDFLSNVPADWEGLWLGGQHQAHTYDPLKKSRRGSKQPETVAPGVKRAYSVERTHCYALRGEAIMRDLFRTWNVTNVHCDWVLGTVQERHNVYAPERFFACQRQGKSDISGSDNPRKCWNDPVGEQPTVFLSMTDREAVAELRRRGFHTGYDRDPQSDVDNGLRAIFDTPDITDAQIKQRVRTWVRDIQWECAQTDGLVTTVWHPKVTAEHLKGVPQLVRIEAATAAEALAQLPAEVEAKLKKVVAPPVVVVLKGASAGTVDRLRNHGWHFGYWRDDKTGIDRGVSAAFDQTDDAKRTEKLRDLLSRYLVREADSIRNGVAVVRHPKATKAAVQAATGLRVVEVEADDVGVAIAALETAKAETPAATTPSVADDRGSDGN